MRYRRRKTLQRKLPLTPPHRINLPRAGKEEAMSSTTVLTAAQMERTGCVYVRQPQRVPQPGRKWEDCLARVQEREAWPSLGDNLKTDLEP